MTLPSVRLLTEAFQQLLVDAGLAVFESRVDPVQRTDNRGVVKGHAIVHPVAPGAERTALTGQPGSLLAAFQVDCVGGTHGYVLDVVDAVIAAVDGKTLTVAAAAVGIISPPLGYQRRAPYRDPGAAPFQLRLPLQYQVLAVPADPA